MSTAEKKRSVRNYIIITMWNQHLVCCFFLLTPNNIYDLFKEIVFKCIVLRIRFVATVGLEFFLNCQILYFCNISGFIQYIQLTLTLEWLTTKLLFSSSPAGLHGAGDPNQPWEHLKNQFSRREWVRYENHSLENTAARNYCANAMCDAVIFLWTDTFLI